MTDFSDDCLKNKTVKTKVITSETQITRKLTEAMNQSDGEE